MLPLPEPPLTDDVVCLRPWMPADAPALAAAWADPEVARWTAVPARQTVDEARRWIAGSADRRQAGVALDLVLCEVDGDEVLGEVGLADVRWDRRAAQIGYWLALGARGRGVATRAVRLLTDWELSSAGFHMLVARCHADNERSQRVARRVGYTEEGHDPTGYVLLVRRSPVGCSEPTVKRVP